VDYGWYLNYSKDNVPTLEFSLCEKKQARIPGNPTNFYKHSNTRGEEERVCFGKEKAE
jgi:hypothetical protein